jgi:hypothetical protein
MVSNKANCHVVDLPAHTSQIGITNHVLSPSRLAYWEAWRRWHVETLRAGDRPFMLPGPTRPFPAPAEPAELVAA